MEFNKDFQHFLAREHLTQEEFCQRIGRTRDDVIGSIRPEVSQEVFLAFGIGNHIKDSLYSSVEQNKETKLSKQKWAESLQPWLQKFPIHALKEMGFIEKSAKGSDLAIAILRFMGVGNIAGFNKYYETLQGTINPQTYASWIRIGEKSITNSKTDFYPGDNLIRSNLEFLRRNSFLRNSNLRTATKEALENCGITYIEVPPFINAPVPLCASYWVGDVPVVQVTTTKVSDCNFLKAVTHAVGHFLFNRKRFMCLQFSNVQTENNGLSAACEKARRFADDILLSEQEECEIICCGHFEERRCIEHFSGSFHVRPSIIVDRLQQQKKLSSKNLLNNFKVAI